MNAFKKIEYYDLREEIAKKSSAFGKTFVGRKEEIARMNRIIGKRINNNVLVIGAAGIGKTAFVHSWLKELNTQKRYESCALVQFPVEHLHLFNDPSVSYAEALETLPQSIFFVDDFGSEINESGMLLQQVMRGYVPLLKNPRVRVVFSLTPAEYAWLSKEQSSFVQFFETITLKTLPHAECVQIIEESAQHLAAQHTVTVPALCIEEIVSYVERFPALGQLPLAGIHLLDECISASVTKNHAELTSEDVAQVVADKTGIPASKLSTHEMQDLATLAERMNARIIDQKNAVEKIATTLQRAKLGLRNPNKPLGSFLLLGSSGVGKTETAKLVAELLFGRAESFIRYDMSEFQQDHTIQRLIGAPAGYIGYEEGGSLTNALHSEPHSLVLLDEIEKGHPKIFDIFLQVLDDGRLTSGQNETIDARNVIFMATSNIGVNEILEGYDAGADITSEVFIREKIIPVLSKTFRLEFLNRFDSILIFNPLTLPALVQIAELEVKKIEKRLAKHRVQFNFDPKIIEARIKGMADPRFGARPVKRFIEETCESLLAQSLLAETNNV